MLQIKNLSKSYGAKKAISNLKGSLCGTSAAKP